MFKLREQGLREVRLYVRPLFFFAAPLGPRRLRDSEQQLRYGAVGRRANGIHAELPHDGAGGLGPGRQAAQLGRAGLLCLSSLVVTG